MRKQTARDFARIANIQSDAMNDRCNILHITRSSGTYSTQGTETRVMVSGVACGFWLTDGQVMERGQVLLVAYDATLRLQATQTIGLADEVQLIEKGEFMVSGTFKLSGNPTVNSSVQHVKLKRVVA